MGLLRLLEWIFFFYFLTHIPITVFIDSIAVVPKDLGKLIYPQAAQDLLKWYTKEFRDPLMVDPPAWFKSFIYCEVFFQFPFFFFAAYAFWKGSRRWIRVPAIVYSTHVATTLIPILSHIFLVDFKNSKSPGPETFEQRLILCSVYMPYLILPLLILVTMLWHPAYKTNVQQKQKGNFQQKQKGNVNQRQKVKQK